MDRTIGQILSFVARQLNANVETTGDIPFLSIDAATAFEFSCFTGATYVDNDIFPFCPRPHIKLFDKPFALNFSVGMFENGVAISSVEQITKMYPIVKADKFKLVVCTFETESQWRLQLKQLIQDKSETQPYLALRLESSKKGWGLEPLLEWGFSMELKALGLISESQVPLGASVGTPDAQGFVSPLSRLFIESITSKKYSTLSIPELLGYQYFGPASTFHGAWNYESTSVVGEAKTGGSSGSNQLKKYMDSGMPDQAFFLSDANSSNTNYGSYLTDGFRQNPRLVLRPNAHRVNSAYIDWLEITLVSTFFASLPLERRNRILDRLGKIDSMSFPKVVSQYGKEEIMILINELGH